MPTPHLCRLQHLAQRYESEGDTPRAIATWQTISEEASFLHDGLDLTSIACFRQGDGYRYGKSALSDCSPFVRSNGNH